MTLKDFLNELIRKYGIQIKNYNISIGSKTINWKRCDLNKKLSDY